MNVNMKKVVVGIVALNIALGGTYYQVHAADLKTSIGSTMEDSNSETKTGQDITQKQKTEYYDPYEVEGTTDSSSREVAVYVTQASSYAVKIPKTVILDGKNGTGSYQVSVKGNISGNQKIKVAPKNDTIILEEQNAGVFKKDNVEATIIQPKREWTQNQVLNAEWTPEVAYIAASNITAGSWKGSVAFDITLENE
ncbi:hypothetical protein ACTQ6A_12750 [Lachnospiraceae bacterium LCP25S3_G4]